MNILYIMRHDLICYDKYYMHQMVNKS